MLLLIGMRGSLLDFTEGFWYNKNVKKLRKECLYDRWCINSLSLSETGRGKLI